MFKSVRLKVQNKLEPVRKSLLTEWHENVERGFNFGYNTAYNAAYNTSL